MAPWHLNNNNFHYNQRFNNNVHMGRWRKQNNHNNHNNTTWVPHNPNNSHYNYSHHQQHNYNNNNRGPIISPPTA
eukprot:11625856-Karenia_brevis.AAC.1